MSKETTPISRDEARPHLDEQSALEDCSGGCDACCSGTCGTSDSCQHRPSDAEKPAKPTE